MTRPLRIEFAAARYHVTSRGEPHETIKSRYEICKPDAKRLGWGRCAFDHGDFFEISLSVIEEFRKEARCWHQKPIRVTSPPSMRGAIQELP